MWQDVGSILCMKNLKKRREAKGLSRFELAKRSGTSPNTIYDIEMRGTATSVTNAINLARALGTTVEDLMGRKAS
jgi:transcriptional regulator with XRE-family HTH domain